MSMTAATHVPEFMFYKSKDTLPSLITPSSEQISKSCIAVNQGIVLIFILLKY